MLYSMTFYNTDGELVELYVTDWAKSSIKARTDSDKGATSECDHCVTTSLRNLEGGYDFECFTPAPMKLYSTNDDEEHIIRKMLDVNIMIRNDEDFEAVNEMIQSRNIGVLYNSSDIVDGVQPPRFIGTVATEFVTYTKDTGYPMMVTIQFEDRLLKRDSNFIGYVWGSFWEEPSKLTWYYNYKNSLTGIYKPYELLLEILSWVVDAYDVYISKEYHHQNGMFEDELDLRVWLRNDSGIMMDAYDTIIEDILTIYNYRIFQGPQGAYYIVSRNALDDGAQLHKANKYVLEGEGNWSSAGDYDSEPDVLNASYCSDEQWLLSGVSIGYKKPYNYINFNFNPDKRYVQRAHSNKAGDFYWNVEFYSGSPLHLNPEVFKGDYMLGTAEGDGTVRFLANDNSAVKYTYFEVTPEGWNTNGDFYNIEFDVRYDYSPDNSIKFWYVVRWWYDNHKWSVNDNNEIVYDDEIWHNVKVNTTDKQKAEVRFHIPKDEIKTIHNEAKLQIFFIKENQYSTEYVRISGTKQYPEYINFDDSSFHKTLVLHYDEARFNQKTISFKTGFDVEKVYQLQYGHPCVKLADTEYYSRNSTAIDGQSAYINIYEWYKHSYNRPIAKMKATIHRKKPITFFSIYYDDETDVVYELVNDSWDLYTNEHKVEYIENSTIELPYHKVDCDFNNDFSDVDFCVYYLTPYTKALHNRVTEDGIEEFKGCTLQMRDVDCSQSVTAVFEYNECLDETIKQLSKE